MASWSEGATQIEVWVGPWDVVRQWLREVSIVKGAAPRSLERAANTTCGLILLLFLRPGLLVLTNLLVGAFAQFVATRRRPLTWAGHMPEGLGIGPAVPCATLRGLYGTYYAPMWRSTRINWSQFHFVDALVVLVAALWDCARVPLCSGVSVVTSAWVDRPTDRVLLCSGWLAGVSARGLAHWVGLTCHSSVLCSRFGTQQVGNICAEVMHRVPHVQEVSFLAGVEGWEVGGFGGPSGGDTVLALETIPRGKYGATRLVQPAYAGEAICRYLLWLSRCAC